MEAECAVALRSVLTGTAGEKEAGLARLGELCETPAARAAFDAHRGWTEACVREAVGESDEVAAVLALRVLRGLAGDADAARCGAVGTPALLARAAELLAGTLNTDAHEAVVQLLARLARAPPCLAAIAAHAPVVRGVVDTLATPRAALRTDVLRLLAALLLARGDAAAHRARTQSVLCRRGLPALRATLAAGAGLPPALRDAALDAVRALLAACPASRATVARVLVVTGFVAPLAAVLARPDADAEAAARPKALAALAALAAVPEARAPLDEHGVLPAAAALAADPTTPAPTRALAVALLRVAHATATATASASTAASTATSGAAPGGVPWTPVAAAQSAPATPPARRSLDESRTPASATEDWAEEADALLAKAASVSAAVAAATASVPAPTVARASTGVVRPMRARLVHVSATDDDLCGAADDARRARRPSSAARYATIHTVHRRADSQGQEQVLAQEQGQEQEQSQEQGQWQCAGAWTEADAGGDSTTEQRRQVATEILTTERSYVAAMGQCVATYLEALRGARADVAGALPAGAVATLFGNYEDVFKHNRRFLHMLEDAVRGWGPQSTLGSVFDCFWEGYTTQIYSEYANNYDDAIALYYKLMDDCPAFHAFVLDAKTAGLDLASYLIMPIQRLPRYMLLLQSLVQATPPMHPDAANVQRICTRARAVVDDINTRKRRHEEQAKLRALADKLDAVPAGTTVLDGVRTVLKEGPVVDHSTSKSRYLYLFVFLPSLPFHPISCVSCLRQQDSAFGHGDCHPADKKEEAQGAEAGPAHERVPSPVHYRLPAQARTGQQQQQQQQQRGQGLCAARRRHRLHLCHRQRPGPR